MVSVYETMSVLAEHILVVVMCHQDVSDLWWLYGMSDLQHLLSLAALNSSSTL